MPRHRFFRESKLTGRPKIKNVPNVKGEKGPKQEFANFAPEIDNLPTLIDDWGTSQATALIIRKLVK